MTGGVDRDGATAASVIQRMAARQHRYCRSARRMIARFNDADSGRKLSLSWPAGMGFFPGFLDTNVASSST